MNYIQSFNGMIGTNGIEDTGGVQTPSLTAEKVTAPTLVGTATQALADGNGANIPGTYATKEELAAETTAREEAISTEKSALEKSISEEAATRAAADKEMRSDIDDILDGTIAVGKASNDGDGNNIASTYVTKTEFDTELNAGLNKKSDKFETYTAENCSFELMKKIITECKGNYRIGFAENESVVYVQYLGEQGTAMTFGTATVISNPQISAFSLYSYSQDGSIYKSYIAISAGAVGSSQIGNVVEKIEGTFSVQYQNDIEISE